MLAIYNRKNLTRANLLSFGHLRNENISGSCVNSAASVAGLVINDIYNEKC